MRESTAEAGEPRTIDDWAAETGATAVADLAEIRETQSRLKMTPGLEFTSREARDGRPIYIVRCANGHHESYDSHAHALALLVDSHRTRAEDTPVVHERIMHGWGGDVAHARKVAAHLSQLIRSANPNANGEERDAILIATIDARDAEIAKEREGAGRVEEIGELRR